MVTVTNTADGGRWRTTTRADGRYAFEYLSVGGPYAIEARAIGFRPAGETAITLSLGERRRADIALTPAVIQLAELTVQAPDPRLNGSRTGPAPDVYRRAGRAHSRSPTGTSPSWCCSPRRPW